jgi:4-amino-4-deoxy-L-arabinose transferase-like glycosyltransferase
LLFQTTLSVVYRLGGGDVAARLLVVALGLATVLVVYLLGRLLYGHRVGLVAALLLAAMPYHVGVSRQVLLDVPMTFMATTSLYFVARFCCHPTCGRC